MVDPVTTFGLSLAGKSQGQTAQLAMTVQGAKLADSMFEASKVNELKKATAATSTENTKIANRGLKPRISKRNENFSPARQKDSLDSVDPDWKSTGAKSPVLEKVLRRSEPPDKAWSRIGATSERLSKIDPDFSRNGSQLYAIA